MAKHEYVQIYHDGGGTYQAQCMGCDWKGPWRRKQEKTTEDAAGHSNNPESLFNDRRGE